MGWKALPVRCERCGRLFPADNIIGGSGTVMLEDVYVQAPCPWCGSREGGFVPNGSYAMGESVSRDLATLTADEIKQVRTLLTQARDSQTDEAVRAIAEIAPAIAAAIRSRPKSSWAALIGIVLTLIALWQPADDQPEIHVHVDLDDASEGDSDEANGADSG